MICQPSNSRFAANRCRSTSMSTTATSKGDFPTLQEEEEEEEQISFPHKKTSTPASVRPCFRIGALFQLDPRRRNKSLPSFHRSAPIVVTLRYYHNGDKDDRGSTLTAPRHSRTSIHSDTTELPSSENVGKGWTVKEQTMLVRLDDRAAMLYQRVVQALHFESVQEFDLIRFVPRPAESEPMQRKEQPQDLVQNEKRQATTTICHQAEQNNHLNETTDLECIASTSALVAIPRTRRIRLNKVFQPVAEQQQQHPSRSSQGSASSASSLWSWYTYSLVENTNSSDSLSSVNHRNSFVVLVVQRSPSRKTNHASTAGPGPLPTQTPPSKSVYMTTSEPTESCDCASSISIAATAGDARSRKGSIETNCVCSGSEDAQEQRGQGNERQQPRASCCMLHSSAEKARYLAATSTNGNEINGSSFITNIPIHIEFRRKDASPFNKNSQISSCSQPQGPSVSCHLLGDKIPEDE